MKKITIKDIARMAEVSPTTVSLVLNDRPNRISKDKKKLIFEIAKKYNYTPNLNARGLVSNKTNMIGLIIPDIENPFFAKLAKVLEKEVNKKGYSLILFNTNDLYENDLKGIRLLNMRGTDAFFIVLSNEAMLYEKEIKKALKGLNKPFVLLDRPFNSIKCNQVTFNDKLGQYLATKHLIDKGYKNIGYIAADKNSLNGNNRLKGYLKAVNEFGLKDDLVVHGNYKFDSGYNLVDTLLNKNIDSLVVANDVMAYGAIKRLTELGVNVSKDFEVVGYDDLIYSSMFLKLTSVNQDVELLGKTGSRLLFEFIGGKKNVKNVILEPKLIIRDNN